MEYPCTIAIDIDGTLTNDIQIAKECIARWNNRVGPLSDRRVDINIKKKDLFVFPPFFNREEFWEYTSSIHKDPPIDVYTVDAIRGLWCLGCKIIIITKRPNAITDHGAEGSYTETANWLRSKGVRFDALICTDDKTKIPYLNHYKCNYILENDPMILKDIRNSNCSTIPVLIRKPYNAICEKFFKRAIFVNSVYDFYIYLAKSNHMIRRIRQ